MPGKWLKLGFVRPCLCIIFESNTLIFSNDMERKPFLLHTDGTGWEGRTDSSDTICAPIENSRGGDYTESQSCH